MATSNGAKDANQAAIEKAAAENAKVNKWLASIPQATLTNCGIANGMSRETILARLAEAGHKPE